MLKYDTVFASLSKQRILSDISVSFPYGTITSILGPNGCGKSTLLRCLTQKNIITSGMIYLDGRFLYEYSLQQRAKRIAFLPQLKEIPHITVKTLVMQGRFPYHGIFHRENKLDMYFIHQSMKDTNVFDLSDKPLTSLSGGECQRAYLAMILAQNTDYIILDEPTTFLDIRHRLEFLELLKALRNRGKTIIVILHDINEAIEISDVMILMKEGRIVRTLTRNEFLNSSVMEEVFQVNFSYRIEQDKTFTSFTIP